MSEEVLDLGVAVAGVVRRVAGRSQGTGCGWAAGICRRPVLVGGGVAGAVTAFPEAAVEVPGEFEQAVASFVDTGGGAARASYSCLRVWLGRWWFACQAARRRRCGWCCRRRRSRPGVAGLGPGFWWRSGRGVGAAGVPPGVVAGFSRFAAGVGDFDGRPLRLYWVWVVLPSASVSRMGLPRRRIRSGWWRPQWLTLPPLGA